MNGSKRPNVHVHAMVRLGGSMDSVRRQLGGAIDRNKLTQQKLPTMFGKLTRETLTSCARKGAICRYYHAAARLSSLHSTQLHIGTPILRQPMAHRPDFKTPSLSEFYAILYRTTNLY